MGIGRVGLGGGGRGEGAPAQRAQGALTSSLASLPGCARSIELGQNLA